jgi:hypothetical protein
LDSSLLVDRELRPDALKDAAAAFDMDIHHHWTAMVVAGQEENSQWKEEQEAVAAAE